MTKKRFQALLISVLSAALLFCMTAVPVFGADSVVTQKETHTYDIAVVYDNSTSMYNGAMWCQAKYAMEIFASMLDYSRDRLTIYPMWEVQTVRNPQKPSEIMEYDPKPVEIRSIGDIDKIHYMYTTVGSDTPLTPAEDAVRALGSSDATDKWLVVLTDGVFNSDGKDVDNLPEFADLSKNIKVQYLAMGGSAKAADANESKGFYADKANSGEELNEALISICNRIFERNKLPQSEFKNGKVSLDVSMNRLIVFVQGDGAEISSLTGSNGNVGVISDSGQRKYSGKEYSLGYGKLGDLVLGVGERNESITVIDDSLYGQVVVFDGCQSGEYVLNYTGDPDKVQIFYEPNVKIKYTLTKDGEDITALDESLSPLESIEIDEGDYTLDYYLVDGVTGERVDSSELLGKVEMSGTLSYSGGDGETIKAGRVVTLIPNESATFCIDGTYLGGKYSISTRDTQGTLSIVIKPIVEHDLGINISTEQTRDFYYTKKADEWQPMIIKLDIDGSPLTDEQLADVMLDLKFDPAITHSEPQILSGESAFAVYIGKRDANGTVDAEGIKNEYLGSGITKGFKFSADASYIPEDTGKEISANKSKSFTVSKVPQALIDFFFLIIIAALLALALLIYIILKNWKCYPKKVVYVCGNRKRKINFKRNTNSLVFSTPRSISMKRAIKKSNLLNRRKKSATFGITGLMVDEDQLSSIMIGGDSFNEKRQGKFIYDDGTEVDWSKYSVESVYDGFTIIYTTVAEPYIPAETYVCKFEIN